MSSEFINEREQPNKGFTYICVGCRTTFQRTQKLNTDRYEPRCPTCHEVFRKASKRATWRKHAPEYRARQAEAQKAAERELEIEEDGNKAETEPARQASHESPKVTQIAPKIAQNLQGRQISRLLPGGRRIVWMADDLITVSPSSLSD